MPLITHNRFCSQLTEIRFQSNTAYQHPFSEVKLEVAFTDPAGKERTVPAYWAGGSDWVVRYSSRIAGSHRYISHCNTVDEALHQIAGEIEIEDYTGGNPLWQHGAPKVAKDGRHLAYDDDTPFFWLGDTWWLGLTKRLAWPEDFQALAADRQTKGFSVVQIVAGFYPDMPAFDERGLSESGFAWQKDYSAINPAFFDEADQRIMHLVNCGIVPCILGAWGYYLPWLGTLKMQAHWQYIMARWGALPVIWAAAGEQTMPWYLSTQKEQDTQTLKSEWSKVVDYMRTINAFGRLITTHPHKSARDSVDNPALIDFEMQQTGHHGRTLSHAQRAWAGWQFAPKMPVVCGESRYEALSIIPAVTTKDARQAFWAHMLNSGCAGHTYGVNGVWQVNLPGAPFGKSPGGHNWGLTPWQEAMQLPGSTQLASAKKLLLNLPWHQLIPIEIKSQRWQKYWQPLLNHWRQQAVAGAMTNDKSLAVYYLLSLSAFSVDLCQFPQPVFASWFDPVSGKLVSIESQALPNKGSRLFTPIAKNAAGDRDWILLLSTSLFNPI